MLTFIFVLVAIILLPIAVTALFRLLANWQFWVVFSVLLTIFAYEWQEAQKANARFAEEYERGQQAIKDEQSVKAQEEAKEDARWRAEHGDPEDPWNQRLAHGQSLYNSDGSVRLTPYYSLPVMSYSPER
jgi:hypothetical protein